MAPVERLTNSAPVAPVARACKADAEHVCAVKTGQPMQECLKVNQAQLSANCKEAVSKLPPKS